MTIDAFWSKPPDYSRSREIDPLGLSTLHEACADILLPALSGRTQDAEHYLWVLIGLRWAAESASTEAGIWDQFERFEKALKLRWFDGGRRQGFSGVDAVAYHHGQKRTDLRFTLLSNQRSQGLLGAYLRSLRAGDLVERRSLQLRSAGRALVEGIVFRWGGEISGYGWLAQAFDRASDEFSRTVLKELGGALFDPPTMRDVATAIHSIGGRPAWHIVGRRLTALNPKRAVASIGNDLSRFSQRATRAFWTLLESPDTPLAQIGVGGLRSRAWRDAVFSDGLKSLRGPFDNFLRDIHLRPKPALIALHGAMWDRRGHTVPWIRAAKREVHVRQDIKLKAPPAESGWDLRWIVAHRLIQQTRWRPS